MAVARPEGAAAPSELPMSMLSKKMSQNQWARMQGVLGRGENSLFVFKSSNLYTIQFSCSVVESLVDKYSDQDYFISKGVSEGGIGKVGFQDGVGGQSECLGADVGEETEEKREGEVNV